MLVGGYGGVVDAVAQVEAFCCLRAKFLGVVSVEAFGRRAEDDDDVLDSSKNVGT